MQKENRREIAGLVLNVLIFVNVLVIACTGIFRGAGEGQVGTGIIGLSYFKPFTMDSNVLAGASSLCLLVCGIRSLMKKEDVTPKWAVTFQLMSTACLCLTMIVAALFLGPMQVMFGGNYFVMFKGDMFFFHFLNPVLGIISFTCCQKKYRYLRRECLWGMIPTIIYSFVYLFMVVIVKKWEDFYNFTFGGRYYMVPVVFVVIYTVVCISSLLLIRGNRGHR